MLFSFKSSSLILASLFFASTTSMNYKRQYFINSMYYRSAENQDIPKVNCWIRMRNPLLAHKNACRVAHQYLQSEIKFTASNQSYTFDKVFQEWLSNHEVYEKAFAKMIYRVQRGIQQTYYCLGEDDERLQTFLGNPSDPGILIIIMIYLLQEKYKYDHGDINLKISFFEYSNGQFYDLLNTSAIPLQLISRNQKYLDCIQSVKINEYIEFLRLLKIALYNNKGRDYRITKNQISKGQKDSVFFAKIQIAYKFQGKINNSCITLVDFPNQKKKEKSNIKSEWDHIVNIMKNGKSDEKLDQSKCKLFLHRSLINGYNCFLYCMSPLSQKFSINLNNLLTLRQMDKNVVYQQRLKQEKKKNYNPSDFLLNLKEHIEKIQKLICGSQYNCLDHLSIVKQNLQNSLAKLIEYLQKSVSLIIRTIDKKALLNLQNNLNLLQQKQLIGNCVKTQTVSEFYLAKTYQSLYREVNIKTQETSKRIDSALQKIFQLNTSYLELLKTQKFIIRHLSSFQDPILHTILSEISVLFKKLIIFCRQTEKRIHLNLEATWLQKVAQKIQLEDVFRKMLGLFAQLINQLRNQQLENKCKFKQNRILSSNNIINKTNNYLTTMNKTVFPKVLFKKLGDNQNDCKTSKKHQIRLSDFLLKVKRQA